MRLKLCVGLACVLISGCGEPSTKPPPIEVSGDGRSTELSAFVYCYENACVDGEPPVDLSDVGDPEALTVTFPLSDWSFRAELTASGERCSRVVEAPLERQDDETFLLRPAGYAGTYDVTLIGEGPGGDLSVAFEWTTPTDGPLPVPEARLAILANNGGLLDSYGVELELKNLTSTPSDASATISVTAPDGRSVTFAGDRADLDCAEGSVYWDGPDDEGKSAADLGGGGPFTYDVAVVLDGIRYVATAVWPDDQIVGNEPSVALDFNPALPALSPLSRP